MGQWFVGQLMGQSCKVVHWLDGSQLRKGLCSRKLDTCGPVLPNERKKLAPLSVQLEYRRGFWRDVSADSADNKPSLYKTAPIRKLGGTVITELDRTYPPCGKLGRSLTQSLYLDYAEYAAAALEGLGSVYHLQGADKARLRQAILRLKGINTLIKKRYESKVGILLELASLSFEVGEQQEAAEYLTQADRYYSQQLAGYPPSYGRITWLAERLLELKALIQPGTMHTIAFTITANTPDEVQAILATLEQHRVPGLEVTRKVSLVSSGSGRGGVRYTARLRLTVRNKR